jgi:prevent-host-death family protein
MALLAKDLRKNLFQVLEEVSQGASVEVNYKGKPIRISMAEPSSRLSRLVSRDLGLKIEAGDTGWNSTEWEKEIETLLPNRPRK